MKRFFKILKISGIVFFLLIAALAIAPFLFKDKIKALVMKEIDKNINAKVYVGAVDLSFLRSFPNASISLEKFGVIGVEDFKGDTLIAADELQVAVDLKSIWEGKEYNVKKIALDKPNINVIILKNGKPNWDIAKTDTSVHKKADTVATKFKLKLNEYEINEGNISYEDKSSNLKAVIKNLTHSGSGDFTEAIYDLATETQAQSVTVDMEGTRYLNNAKIDADVTLNINSPKNTYTFKQNEITINNLPLKFDGLVMLNGDNTNLNLSFSSTGTTFKNVLSMVPGVFTKDFEDIKTEGNFSFSGNVKGTYNAGSYPAINLNLKVGNGFLQYPSLPTPVSAINVDMTVNNPQGKNFDNMKLDIRSFKANFGKNPVEVQGTVSGLNRMIINGKAKANLNLGELTTMFPIEGTDLKGQFVVDAVANGIYDEAAKTFPKVDAKMSMTNGYIKNKTYPAELKNVQFSGTLKNENGALDKTFLDVPKLHIDLDNEPIDGRVAVSNFDNPNFDVQLNGILDLEKLLKIYPIEGMKLAGKLFVDNFATKGVMSDIENERYMNVPTSGKVRVQNLKYSSTDLAYPVSISTGTADFTPAQIGLSGVNGVVGKTDFKMSGNLTNYLGYALLEKEVLGGNLQLSSSRLNVNDWMSDAPATAASTPESSTMEVVPVPANLNINVKTSANEVLYDKLTLKNFNGNVTVANKVLKFNEVLFNTFGGTFGMTGEYDTKNETNPLYAFRLNIKELLVQDAYKYFNTFKSIMPLAQFIDGKFNTQLAIAGSLDNKMNPNLSVINSEGIFELIQSKLTGTPITAKLAEVTKINQLKEMSLENARSKFVIENGILKIAPFTLKLKDDILVTIGGEQGLGGVLNYDIFVDAAAGKVGATAQQALSNFTKGIYKPTDRIKALFKLTGVPGNPIIKFVSSTNANEIKDQLKDAAAAKAEDIIKNKTGVDVQLNKDSLKNQLNQVKNDLKNEVKNEIKQKETEIKQQANQVKNQVQDTIKSRATDLKNEVKGQVKNKLDDLKGKFPPIKWK